MTFAETLHHLRQKQSELIDCCRACPDSCRTRTVAESLLTQLQQLAGKSKDEQRETVPHLYREWQLLLASVPTWWPLLPWGASETGRADPEEHPELLQLIEATGFVRNLFVQADTLTNDDTTAPTPVDETPAAVRASWFTRLWRRFFGGGTIMKLQKSTTMQLLTYPNQSATLSKLTAWACADNQTAHELRRFEEIHDTLAVLHQHRRDEPLSTQQAAAWLQACAASKPVVADLKQTVVLLAQVAGDKQAHAAALLQELTGSAEARGSELAPGVELFTGAYPGWLIVLTNPDETATQHASALIYRPLRVVEICHHKLLLQQTEYSKLQAQLKTQQHHLHQELDRLSQQIDTQTETTPQSLTTALTQNHSTTTAYRTLTETVAQITALHISLQANAANLDVYLTQLGNPTALEQRRHRTHLAVEQIRADLARVQPLLDQAQWLSDFHQTQLLTVLGVAEVQENQLRRADAARGERTNLLLVLLGLWVAVIQIWSTAVSSRPDGTFGEMMFLFVVMALPVLPVGLLAWLLVRWLTPVFSK